MVPPSTTIDPPPSFPSPQTSRSEWPHPLITHNTYEETIVDIENRQDQTEQTVEEDLVVPSEDDVLNAVGESSADQRQLCPEESVLVPDEEFSFVRDLHVVSDDDDDEGVSLLLEGGVSTCSKSSNDDNVLRMHSKPQACCDVGLIRTQEFTSCDVVEDHRGHSDIVVSQVEDCCSKPLRSSSDHHASDDKSLTSVSVIESKDESNQAHSEKENLIPVIAPSVHKSAPTDRPKLSVLPIAQQLNPAKGNRDHKQMRKSTGAILSSKVDSCQKKLQEKGNNNVLESSSKRHVNLPLSQRQVIISTNTKKRSADSPGTSLMNPLSARNMENEDEQPPAYSPSGGRASIESNNSSLRQRGSASYDDVRRFSSFHATSRSSSRSEKSLRGGKIDRVARFAELQKIWKKDSFVRGIDGEKRPQILQHLFAPLRATTNSA